LVLLWPVLISSACSGQTQNQAALPVSAASSAVALNALKLQQGQAENRNVWLIAKRLLVVKNGFISGDQLENMVGFSLTKKTVRDGYYEMFGGHGVGDENYSVNYSYMEHRHLPPGFEKSETDSSEMSIGFKMPAVGCLTLNDFQNEMKLDGYSLLTKYKITGLSEVYENGQQSVTVSYSVRAIASSNRNKDRNYCASSFVVNKVT
jgi:hypothetical protein